jgi:hypothetical protein
MFQIKATVLKAGLSNAAPAGPMAPVIYFPGTLIYSAGFNVNQNVKKKIFLNNTMFQFFSYHSHEHGLPAFANLFPFVPFYCPLTPYFTFSLEKAPAFQVIASNK